MQQLPHRARAKLEALAEEESAAQDNARTITARLSALSRALATAPTEEAANVEHEMSRLRGRLGDASAKHHALADLNARLDHWLATIGNVQLDDCRPVKVNLAGKTLREAASRIRARIAALQSERQKVEHCGLPLADLKEQAAAYVAGLRERGKPRILYGHARPFAVSFEMMTPGAFTPTLDFAAALAWADPTSFLQRLIEDLESQPKASLSLSAKQRAERLTTLEAELMVLEREDEAIVCEAEATGPAISRRIDADPRAVLGLITNKGAATKAA
jgi:hypothetical protein